MYPAEQANKKSAAGIVLVAMVVIGLGVAAVSIGGSKVEMSECQRWSKWAPQNHAAWQQWQIDQCKSHKITLQ